MTLYVLCSWASSDSPRMYNVTWESANTLIEGIQGKWPSSDSPRMYNVTWESADTLTEGIYAIGHPRTVPGCTM